MTNEQALNILKQACASIQANLDTHQQIQTALAHVQSELEPTKPEKPAK